MPPATLIAKGAAWRIPAYAQEMLVVQHGAQHSRAHGPRGEFVWPSGADASVTVRWGTSDGPPLVALRLRGEPPSAHWDGAVVIGGAVAMFQVEEVRGLPLAIAHIEGAPVARALVARPTLREMAAGVADVENTARPLADTFTYTVIADAESPLADYLFQALAMDLGVVCTARLGADAGGWHEVSGLPLLVEKLALLPAPNF